MNSDQEHHYLVHDQCQSMVTTLHFTQPNTALHANGQALGTGKQPFGDSESRMVLHHDLLLIVPLITLPKMSPQRKHMKLYINPLAAMDSLP